MPKISLTRSEISALFKIARRVVRHPLFDLLIAPKATDIARIAVATPKRIGNAPARNKIRRQCKAIFYEQKLYERAYDYLLIIKKIEKLPFAQLQELLMQAFAKADKQANKPTPSGTSH